VVWLCSDAAGFVIGHAMVALARQRGADYIDGEVTRLETSYVIGPDVDIAQILHTLDEYVVVQDRERVLASGHHDELGVRQRLRGVGRDHGQAAVGSHRLERPGHEVDLGVGPAADHLVWADEIQPGEVGIQDVRDLHRVWTSESAGRWARCAAI